MKPPPEPPVSAPTSSAAPWVRRWLHVLIGLCLVQFVLLLALSQLWRRSNSPPSPVRALQTYSSTNREPYFSGHPGPWGELEYARINIEPTEEIAWAEERSFGPTSWFFDGQTRAQVMLLSTNLGLTPNLCAELQEQASWTPEPDGVLVLPSSNLVWTLSADVRARLYSVLARSQRNELQVWPFVYRQGGFDEWFGRSGLSEATIALVKQVVYQRGVALCVADAPALCARIPDPAERHRLIKTLARTSALLMKVRVRPDTDVAALAAYWGQGWHVKEIEPLLASLTRVPASITLDVAHLLPPFARKRLNSFPTPFVPGQRAPDCYWSAWNFFNDPPDDRYYDDAVWRQELQQNCTLVEQPTFGDLVFLTRPDGVPVHCAVFIADDVVFTKNGANRHQPWKLMKMDDMLARYSTDYPLRVAVFRPKATPGR